MKILVVLLVIMEVIAEEERLDVFLLILSKCIK
jgi:hypothetical protein